MRVVLQRVNSASVTVGDDVVAAIAVVDGSVLAVSQFTLCASTSRGRRPSFLSAAEPRRAKRLFERFVEGVGSHGIPVETGVFAAYMQIALVNDGPVTIVLDG